MIPSGAARTRSSLPCLVLVLLATTLPSGPALAAPASRPVVSRSVDGNLAVVGASWHERHRGAAYVYRREARGWTLEAALAPAERGAFARFGGSVAIEDDRLVIGAPWDDGWKGAAYVYERRGGEWRLAARLAPEAAVGDRFGARVALEGERASVTSAAGTTARFLAAARGWAEVERTAVERVPATAPVEVDAALGIAIEATEARHGGPAIAAPVALDPPAFVRATDGVYEDRTEIRWAAVGGGPFLYKIYRRVAGDPPAANVLIRVASQDDSLFSDASGRHGVEYTYCVSVVDMAEAEGATRCDEGRRIIFPPTGFSASDATFERFVRLTWSDRSSVESQYRLRRDGALLAGTLPDVSVFDDTTAVPGTTYSYSLVAVDAAGDTTAPVLDPGQRAFIAAPRSVSATDGQHPDKVVVTWIDATRLEVSYLVYRAPGPVGPLATLPPGTEEYEDATAVSGTPYSYCVAAVDASSRESARACDTGGIGILPGPTNVVATDGTFDDKVRITWRDVSDTEDGYLVYRTPPGNVGDSVLVASVGAGVTTCDDLQGAPGVAYDYCIVAHSSRGGRSAPVCDAGLRAIVIAPATVTASDAAFEDRVELVWESTSTTAVLFKIFRGGVFVRSVAGDRRTYSDTELASGVTASYAVRGVSALGVESPPTTDDGSRRIAPPVSVKATDDEFEDRADITWTDRSAIEDGYFVYRRRAGSADPLERIAVRPENGASHSDRTGVPGVAYDYFVAAFQAYGPGRADTTESEPGRNEGRRALLAPTFVDASDGAFEDRIAVAWVDESRYEEAYHVWRRDTATNDSARVAVVPPNSNRYVDATVVFGVTYEYSVHAVDSLGGAMLGKSPAGRDQGNTALLPPLGMNASDLYDDRVGIAWIDQSNRETGYQITRDGVVIGSTPANASSFTDNTATGGTQYDYCVQAVSGAELSPAACDVGRTSGFVADTSPLTFTDLPGGNAAQGFYPTEPGAFGASMDGDGAWLIAGDPRMNWFYQSGTDPFGNPIYTTVFQRGKAYLYYRNDNTTSLSGGFTFGSEFSFGDLALDAGALYLGSQVAMSGDYAMATYKESATSTERVVFMRRSGGSPSSAWTRENTNGLGSLGAGLPQTRIDMSGENAVAANTPAGTVQFFDRSLGYWNFSQGLAPFASRSAAISGATAIVGVSGSVRIYTKSGGAWSQTGTLSPPSPSAAFGASVDIDGNLAVVGSWNNDNSSGAHVFERDPYGVWSLSGTLEPGSAGPGSDFGYSVSIRGQTILVGAPDAGAGTGRVWLFTRVNGSWVRREVLRGPNGCANCVTSAVSRGTVVKVLENRLLASDPAGRRLDSFNHSRPYVEGITYPPLTPVAAASAVSATDEDYRDRVQIKWTDNSTTEAGFKVYRDGALIATLDPNVKSYVDFDAAPGRTHEYCVTAFVDPGAIPPGASGTESLRGCDFGRRPPNGNITGRISTLAGSGVSGVAVCLDPSPNRALLFDGTGGTMTVADGSLFGASTTVEFWYRGLGDASGTLLNYSASGTPDAFAVKNPANLTVYVNGASRTTSVAINDGVWHHVAIAWASAGGSLEVYRDGVSAFSGVHASGQIPTAGGALVFGASLAGAIDDIRVWSRVRSQAEIQSRRFEILAGNESDLLAYWPLDDSEGLGAEELHGHRYGRISAGAHWIGEAPPMNTCALTDVQGNYVLSELHYGNSTTFKVTPSVAGHQFSPGFKTITLSTGSPVQNEVGFNDVTAFTVAGRVRHSGTSCAAQNVPIFVDGEQRGTTDGSGHYAVSVTPGAHRVEAKLTGHAFQPPSLAVVVAAGDVAGQDFVETTRRRLSGDVGGGCGVPIGTLTIQMDSEDGCFSRTIDAASGYDEELPPLKYFVRVTDVTQAVGDGPDPADVIEFFDDLGTREVDLTTTDQALDFQYRAPVRVTIAGLPDPDPTCALGVPVIEQMSRWPLTINVFEDYGSLGTCPVDSGVVTVFDEIKDQERTPVTLVVRNGVAKLETANGLKLYETAANTPNIFAGRRDIDNVDRSYQKSLAVVADIAGRDPTTETIWAIVTGHRPRTATFTAIADGLPLLILHDPPGDGSFSFVEQESTLCNTVSRIGLQQFSTGFATELHTGVKFTAGFGFMTDTEFELFFAGGLEIGFNLEESDEFSVCAKTRQKFSTSGEAAFIGNPADVFVGLSLNLMFAKTDVLRVQDCSVVTSEEITVGVDDVESAHSYTDSHIRNVILPQLDELAAASPADSVRFRSARDTWQEQLALNDSLRRVAPLDRNRSFSAGAEFEYASTVEERRSQSFTAGLFTNSEFAAGFGFDIAGTGSELKFYTKMNLDVKRGRASTQSSTRTTGYTLKDNDIGDYYSVDIKKDLLFGTPIFENVSGLSSCPWEPWPHPRTGAPRMQSRDGAVLSVEPPVALDVDPDGRAEFVLTMLNNNPAEETREYWLMPVQAANPNGASIFVGGDTFIQLPFFLRYGQPTSVSLTIVRGPTAYLYEDIQLVLIPVCEFDYWRNTGIAQLADTVSFTVRFKAPCSDIKLLRPNPGWSAGADDDTLELILSDYELAISESDSLVAIGAEYQRQGTDTWLPIGSERAISTLPRDPITGDPLSLRVHWPLQSVPDGTYAIRAFTRCDQRNYSATATGVIDRSPPQVFGTPEPADGVLSLGENISITFNEDLDCPTANSTTVRLEVVGGAPIGASVTCNGRTLVIAANTELAAYEGQQLRATVTGVRDKGGNPSGTRSWTFVVRRSEFAWDRASVSQDAGYGAGARIAVNLVNGLDQPTDYSLGALPAWLTAETPATGTIPAKSRIEVVLQVVPATALGSYDATITASATTTPPSGTHSASLAVHLNVLRVPPAWTVTPADYEHSMSVRARVYVDADSLVNPEDVLAAFVGEQVRGVARPQLVSDGWRYFLTIYGKPPAYERVRFRVWDSRTSKTYVATDKTLRFVPDTTLGSNGNPFDIRTRLPSPAIEQVIPVSAGWTWFSVNRRPTSRDDRTVAAVLGNVIASPGDLVKAQDGAVAMFDATAGWIGTLDTLGVNKSYRLKAAEAGTIRYESVRVLPSLYPIPVKKGWNWIGYTPDDARSVPAALVHLVAANRDVLRSQTAFAEFGPTAWAGSLATMSPGQGFNLYRSNPVDGQFLYNDLPPGPVAIAAALETAAPEVVATLAAANGRAAWDLDYRAFEHDMVVTAEVAGLALGADNQVAAVVGGEIRGVATPVHVPALGRTIVFLMVRSNRTSGETVEFRVLDTRSGRVYRVDGSVAFTTDAVIGTTAAPLALRSDGVVLETIGLPTTFELGASRPNPVLGGTAARIRYGVPREAPVTLELFDVNGRRVRTIVDARHAPGWYDAAVEPGGLSGGVYFYRLRAGSFTATRRMVVVK